MYGIYLGGRVKTKKQVIIPDLKKLNVLAIDLASISVGYAVSQKGEIIHYSSIQVKGKDIRKRGVEIANCIQVWLKVYDIDLLILEDSYLGVNPKTAMSLAEIRGMVNYRAISHGAEILMVPVLVWKNKYEGIPKQRDEQKLFIMNKFKELTGNDAKNDDEADAYCMLYSLLK